MPNTRLTDLPDEILRMIMIQTDPGTVGDEDAQAFAQICKRVQNAVQPELWRYWNFTDETLGRLHEHQDHTQSLKGVREVTMPAVHGPSKRAGIACETYDEVFASVLRKFESLRKIVMTFYEYEWPSGGVDSAEVIHETLARDRLWPLYHLAFDAVCGFSTTISSLCFDGIGSLGDHYLVMRLVREVKQLRILHMDYRLDWAWTVSSASSEAYVDSRELWEIVGRAQQLQSLRILNLPSPAPSKHAAELPKTFLPSLRDLCLHEVPMSFSLLQLLLADSEATTLSLDATVMALLPSIKPSYFSRLAKITLGLAKPEEHLAALTCFRRVGHLDLVIKLRDQAQVFLASYLHTLDQYAYPRSLEIHTREPQASISSLSERFSDPFAKEGIQLDITKCCHYGSDLVDVIEP